MPDKPIEADLPQVGGFYRRNGFVFRVDRVSATEVYIVRWKGDEERGVAFRVPVEEWIEDMKGVECERE